MKLASPLPLMLACLFMAAPAMSQPFYELTITGMVNEINAQPAYQSDVSSTFSIGDPLLFKIVYDGSTPATGSVGNRTRFVSAVESEQISIGSYNLAIPGNAFNGIEFISGIGEDEISIRMATDLGGQLGPYVGPLEPYEIGFFLRDSTGNVFPGDGTAPPPLSTAIDFNAFDDLSNNFLLFIDPVTIDDGAADLQFEITSISSRVVPEPSSLALLGLGGLLAARRRRTVH